MSSETHIVLNENDRQSFNLAEILEVSGHDLETLKSSLDRNRLVRLKPDWNKDKIRFVTKSRIGVTQIGRLRIDVRPRFSASEMVTLIRYALEGNVHAEATARLPTETVGLDELICVILAQESDRIRKLGLSRLYCPKRERLTVLRGRPDFLSTFPWDSERSISIVCSYHLLTCDNLDNRLLLAAQERACLMEISVKTRRQLLQHRHAWSSICKSIYPSREDFTKVRDSYTRLTEHYRLAHNISELILRRHRPASLFESGREVMGGIVLGMPDLFERFVERMFRETLEPFGLKIESQRPDRGALLDAEGNIYRRVRPDLVVYRGSKPVAVIDAKYKDYWRLKKGKDIPRKKIDNADLYQLFFYAQRLQQKHGLPVPPLAYIVSPLPGEDEKDGGEPIGERFKRVVWRAGHDQAGDVRLVTIPMTEILRTFMKGEDYSSLLSDLVEDLSLDSRFPV